VASWYKAGPYQVKPGHLLQCHSEAKCYMMVHIDYLRSNSLGPEKKKKNKVDVKLSLCFTKHHTMKKYGGMEVQLCAFLTFAMNGGEWTASCPSHFTPQESAPCTHGTGSSVDP